MKKRNESKSERVYLNLRPERKQLYELISQKSKKSISIVIDELAYRELIKMISKMDIQLNGVEFTMNEVEEMNEYYHCKQLVNQTLTQNKLKGGKNER